MPFGMGPRNCIAIRFAKEELKLVLCTLVKQFRFFSVKETGDKIKISDGYNAVNSIVDITVGLASRDE